MVNFKRFSLFITTLAIATTTSALCSTAAEALTIRSGQISGIWDFDYAGVGSSNVGDAFTADYTYDSDNITIRDEFSSENYSYVDRVAPLLSLVIKSEKFSHTFTFVPGMGSGGVGWYQFQSSPLYGEQFYEENYVTASDVLGSIFNSFYAQVYSSRDSEGSSSGSFAFSIAYDSIANAPLRGSGSNNVTFSETTPIPTPAMLPGLVGMAVALMRNRNADQAQSDSEEKA